MTDHTVHAAGVLSLLVFAGAGVTAIVAMVLTIRQRWERIRYLCAGFAKSAAADPFSGRKHELAPNLSRSTPHAR